MLLDLIKLAKPGAFIDARYAVNPQNAIVYRARQPLIDEVREVPMLQDFGIFRVAAIMAGRTQVGVCVRFNNNVVATVTQGDHASFVSDRVKNNIGKARTAMKTSDYLIFDFESRGALLIKKLTKGRGYAS